MSGTSTPRDGRDSNALSVGDVELALSPSGDDPSGRTNQQRALSHVRSGVRSPSSSSGFTPPRRASGFRELSQGLSSPTSSVYRGNDLAGIFAACRDATMELELAVRAAVSHREKCAVVLGAAVAVNIALAEADAVSPALDAVTQTQLKRLCSGVLSTLGLAVARVRVYGQFSRIRKIFRLIRYRATESKFEELRSDLDTLEAQLWNLTGAVGGLGIGGTVAPGPGVDGMTRKGNRGGTRKASVMPDRPRRMLRGGATHWILGGNVRVMCAAGVDGSELWWSSNRSASLSAYDLFLDTHRNIAGISTEPTRTTDADGNDVPNLTGTDKSRCLGICLGDVTAMAAEEASALLWTGTEWGGVATWDTDLGTQWGVVSVLSQKRSAVTAIAAVAGRAAWVALADGSIHEVAVPENHEDESRSSRILCAAGERPTLGVTQTGESTDMAPSAAKDDIPNRPDAAPKKAELMGWGSNSQGRRRHAGAHVREMLRLGALVWCSSDDGVLEAWDVVSGACAVVAPHRDLGACVALVPHPAAGQLVTVHATGAVQLWRAAEAGEYAYESEDVSENESSLGLSRRDRADKALGYRVQRLAGPQPAGGKVVGAAAVDRLLCIGHESGMLKILVLPGGSGGSTESQVSGMSTPSGRNLGGGAVPVVAKLRAHRSGMVLLRSVDGGGHVGVCTAGKFGSMMFWPLAELEAAVAAAQPPRAPRAGVSTGRAPRRDGSFSQLHHISGDDLGSVRDDSVNGSMPPTPASLGKSANFSQASSLGQSTALIPFKDIRLKKCIGEGSFGRVYLAIWSNHTEVAVKMLGPPSSFAGKEDPLTKQMGGKRRGLEVGANAARGIAGASPPRTKHNHHPHAEDSLSSSDDDEAEREGEDAAAAEVLDELEKEVAIMARLRHPNIVLLLGAVRSPPSIVEEFCARGSLFSVLQRHTKPGVPPLEWRVRLQMTLGAAAGMCYLHNCSPPIIHRDLKSPNLMVDRYFRVKVGDFNLSRVAVASVRDSKGTGGQSAAYSTGGLHSPRWMAPEVLQNATYSRASDVYSFAVVMWELRSLQVPWAQYGQWQVMTAVVEEGQRPPLDEVPTPSFDHLTIYDELMEDGWSQEPGDRPAFEEIITRLQGLIDVHAKGIAITKSKEQQAAAAAAVVKPEGEKKHRKTISFGSLRMSSEKALRQSADKEPEDVKAGSEPGSPMRKSVADDESAADKVMTRILSRKTSQKLKSLPQNVRASTEAAKDSLRVSTDSLGPAMAAAVAAEQEAAAKASPAPVVDESEPTTPRDIQISVESADENEPRSPALSPAMSRGASLRRLQKWVSSSGINSPPAMRGGSEDAIADAEPEADAVPPMTSPRRPPPHSRSRSDLTPGKPPLGVSGGNVNTSNPMLRGMVARKNLRESYPPPGSPQVIGGQHRRSNTVDWNAKHNESGDEHD